jgi:hypothetical protein
MLWGAVICSCLLGRVASVSYTFIPGGHYPAQAFGNLLDATKALVDPLLLGDLPARLPVCSRPDRTCSSPRKVDVSRRRRTLHLTFPRRCSRRVGDSRKWNAMLRGYPTRRLHTRQCFVISQL